VEEPRFDLTIEQRKIAVRAISDTWNAIGADVLNAVAEEKNLRNRESATMPTEDVIEVVLDADHVLTYGHIEDPEVLRLFKTYGGDSYELKKELGREAFPYDTCGW
jgi:hypothetical protein